MSNYTPYYEGGWKNEEEMTTTPICADALNHMEEGIQDAHELADGLNAVPTSIRQALYALLSSAAYSTTGLTDEIAVIQSWAQQITAVSVSPTTASISGTGTSQLSATTTPAGGTVTWSSSDTSVATVSSSGLVTGVGNGTTTITASAGGKSATCAVTVTGFVMYSVSNTLTNCTSNNAVAQIAEGTSYTATLTPEEGRKFGSGSVTVTMGGVDVTSTAYSNGNINIASVTGDIVITAYANEFDISLIGGIVDFDTTLWFRYTYDNTTLKTRRTMNPCAIKLVNGRSYTFSIGSLWGTMACGVRVMSGNASTVEGLDFSVTQGTKTYFDDINNSVYASGWLSEDYTYTADADGQIFAVTIKKSDGSNFSDADTASLLTNISFVESM